MSTTLKNSIWPNAGGTLGENKVAIPDGVTIKWPEGDALVGNFVYKDGKLVGFVDTKALTINETKSTTIPYDCVNINLENILEDTLTIIPGERCKSLTTVYGDVVKFLTPKLKELLVETKFELYFENDTKKLIIHTDRISDDMVTNLENLLSEVLPQTIETEKYNHNIEVSWKDINKYANIKTSKELSEFVTKEEFQNDLTSDGSWIYPLNEFTGSFGSYSQYTGKWFQNNSKLRYVKLYAPKASINIGYFYSNSNLKEVWCEVGRGYDANSFFYNCPSLKKITAIFPEGTAFNNFCRGCKELEDVDLSFKDVEVGTSYRFDNIFYNCILNKISVLRFVDRLPDSSKAWQNTTEMTLGIHIDYQNDQEVLTAISDAEAKGWTLTVQWNPGGPTYTTPEASTFGLRGPLIYAKVSEYELPDGTTEKYLDWGHYVTNEEGYETFRSLESAYEYFGLEMNN